MREGAGEADEGSVTEGGHTGLVKWFRLSPEGP